MKFVSLAFLRSSAFLCCLCAGSLVTVSVADEPELGTRRALLIGVSDYASLSDLQFAAKDVQALATLLRARGYFDDDVLALCDNATDAAHRPTKENIDREVARMLTGAGPKDLLLVIFIGHGSHVGGMSYFCPADGRLDDPQTLVALPDLYQQLQASKADIKILVADACRADARLPERLASDPESNRAELAKTLSQPPEGVFVLSSCAPDETATELPKQKRGVLKHLLSQGLSSQADKNQDGQVSLVESLIFMELASQIFAARKPPIHQTPKLYGQFREVPDLAGEYSLRTTSELGIALRLLPAGEFEMGSAEDAQHVRNVFPWADPARVAASYPVHKVRITRPFWIGVYEVTLGQFIEFHKQTKYMLDCQRDGEGGWGFDGSGLDQSPDYLPWRWGHRELADNHPVVNVSWNDAQAYCRWLSLKEEEVYRLPTEAEWEYACRAAGAQKLDLAYDPNQLLKFANVADASARTRVTNASSVATSDGIWHSLKGSDGFPLTAPVGKFRSNDIGIYDMQGNVTEWCADYYDPNYYANSPSEDPPGPQRGTYRVTRGGSWRHSGLEVRTTHRSRETPEARSCSLGFRVVREAAPPIRRYAPLNFDLLIALNDAESKEIEHLPPEERLASVSPPKRPGSNDPKQPPPERPVVPQPGSNPPLVRPDIPIPPGFDRPPPERPEAPDRHELAMLTGGGELLFSDDFSTLKPGWGQVDDFRSLDTNKLVINAKPTISFRRLYDAARFNDVDVRLKVTQLKGDANQRGGLLFWGTDRDNCYAAVIQSNGNFYVARGIQGKWTHPVFFKVRDEVLQGAGKTNELRVVTSGSVAIVLINDRKVARFRGFPPAEGGKIGIVAEATNEAATFSFSDVMVRQGPPPAPSPPQDATLLFADDFQTLDPSWGYPDETCGAFGGMLLLKPQVGTGSLRTYRGRFFEDADIRVKVSQLAGGASAPAGIVFWLVDKENYGTVFVYPNGAARILLRSKGISQDAGTKADWDAVNVGRGAVNELRVVLSGNSATAYVNDKELGKVERKDPPGPLHVGMTGQSIDQAYIWKFSDFRCYRVESSK